MEPGREPDTGAADPFAVVWRAAATDPSVRRFESAGARAVLALPETLAVAGGWDLEATPRSSGSVLFVSAPMNPDSLDDLVAALDAEIPRWLALPDPLQAGRRASAGRISFRKGPDLESTFSLSELPPVGGPQRGLQVPPLPKRPEGEGNLLRRGDWFGRRSGGGREG